MVRYRPRHSYYHNERDRRALEALKTFCMCACGGLFFAVLAMAPFFMP